MGEHIMGNTEQNKMEMFNGLVRTNPLALLLFEDEQDLYNINYILPYSIGIEIECGHEELENIQINIKDLEKIFEKIPTIMSVDFSTDEKRFRIPPGPNGILCLYFISILSKGYLTLNVNSGIHYHCNFSDSFEILYSHDFSTGLKEEILKELDTWEYKGDYNIRDLWGWFKPNPLGTMEYRIGEMTFDYEILIKRILSATKISKRIREFLNIPIYPSPFSKFKREEFKEFLTNLKKLSLSANNINNTNNINNIKKIVSNRVIKI